MAQRKSLWTESILDHLKDGGWYRMEEVLLDAMRLVPPGEASREGIRRRELAFKQHLRRTGRSDRHREAVDTDFGALIQMGARSKVYKSLESLRRNGRIERVTASSGDRLVRLVPAGGSNIVPFKAGASSRLKSTEARAL